MKFTPKRQPLEPRATNYLEKHPDYFTGGRKPPMFDEVFKPRTVAAAKTMYNYQMSTVSKNAVEPAQDPKASDQTRQNFESFFNTINDFLFVLDSNGNTIHVNDTVVNRLGYSREELMGNSVLMVHPAERRGEAGRIVGEMLSGTAEFCPVPICTKSGDQIAVETRVKPGVWDGKPAIFGVSEDISALKLSEEKFSKVFQSNTVLMAVTLLKDSKMMDVNNLFLETLGYARDEVIGKTTSELNLFADQKVRDEILGKFQRNEKVSDIEVEVNAKDGSHKWGLFSVDSIYIGKDQCLLTVIVDITDRKHVEDALKTSERKFSTTVSALPDMLFYLNDRGVFLDCQSSKSDELLMVKEAFIGKTLREIMPPAIATQGMQAITNVMATDSLQIFEYDLDMPNGKKSFELRMVKSAPDELLGIARDITDRKQAELALHESQEKLRVSNDLFEKISSQAPGMLYQFARSPDGTYSISFSSNGIKEIYGCSPEDVRNDFNLLFKVILPEDQSRLIQSIEASAKSMAPWMCEYRAQLPGKSVKWILGNSVPEKMADGTIVWNGFNTDITERKAMDNKLMASESKYRLLIENTHDIIYTLSMDGKFTFVSPSWTTLLGHPISQVEGQNFAPFVHPDDISGCMKFLQAIGQTGQKQEGVEYRVKNTNGFWNWHTSSGVPLKDEAGNIVGFYGIARDITRRKSDQEKLQRALKDAKEAIDDKDKFFGLIAHDLKSPFNGMLGLTRMLYEEYSTLSDEDRKLFILNILKSSQKAFDLLEQMLEWHNLHGGKLSGPTTNINVRSLVDGAVGPLIPSAMKKRISLKNDAGYQLVSAQEMMFGRVIANLVSNAIKFTPSDGKGVISISAAKTTDGFTQITVADNGKGMSEWTLSQLFIDNTSSNLGTDGETGTGLGLSMVKTMVEKMGGKIWAETKVASKDDPTSGSKFHFTLPSAQG